MDCLWNGPAAVEVRPLPGRGRGLLAIRDISAGEEVLVEKAVAWAPATPIPISEASLAEIGNELCHEAKQGITVAAHLVSRVVGASVQAKIADLDPKRPSGTADASSHHPGYAEKAEELHYGLKCLRAWAGQYQQQTVLETLNDEELQRLLLVVMINSHALTRSKGVGGAAAPLLQGLFPFAAMMNHSCTPNCTHMGHRGPPEGAQGEGSTQDEDLWLCVRAVVDIDQGEEVTISYIDDLMTPWEERERFLRAHYFFEGATRRPCDEHFGAVMCADVETQAVQRQLQELSALNSSASAVWERAAELRSNAGNSDEVRQLRMEAVTHYAALLKSGGYLLHHDHLWMYYARLRMAQVMTSVAGLRSRANALPLWLESIRTAEQCYPPNWPSLIPLLQGGIKCAEAAQKGDLAAELTGKLQTVTTMLGRKASL